MKHFASEAKERQKEHGGTAPGKEKNTSGNVAGSEAGDARDKAAAQVERLDRTSAATLYSQCLRQYSKYGKLPEVVGRQICIRWVSKSAGFLNTPYSQKSVKMQYF